MPRYLAFISFMEIKNLFCYFIIYWKLLHLHDPAVSS
uniref:Uncharacterized protein n=1 Tax=Anguilla anguilla TaxID=7936 RepID=A0A0E9S8K7_ANGAN